MPIFNRTYAQTRTEVARLLADVVADGTVLNPTTTTINALALVHQTADQLRGKWLYLNGGALAQLERAIYASSVASPGNAPSGGRIDVLQAFVNSSGSPTAPSTNTTFEVYRAIRPALYNDAIRRNVRRLASRMLVPFTDHSVVLGSRLRNGAFQLWANGAASAPDDWTLGGTGATIARVATLVYPGTRYAAQVTNQVSQAATLSQSVDDYARHSGEAATLKAVVHVTTASRVRIRLTDGVTTWNSDYHDGNGDNELSITGQTLGDALTELTASLRIESGASITATIKKMWLEVGDAVYEYEMDPSLMWVRDILQEDRTGEYTVLLDPELYYIDASLTTETSNPKLVFHAEHFTPLSGKVLRIRGQAHPAEPSAETDNLEVDPQVVVYRAAEELLAVLPWGENDRYNWRAKHTAALQRAEAMERRLSPRPYAGSKRVKEF